MQSLNMLTIHDPELVAPDGVELIPQSQREINEQADKALRELFPKIPNTDRGEIINHAFRKVSLLFCCPTPAACILPLFSIAGV